MSRVHQTWPPGSWEIETAWRSSPLTGETPLLFTGLVAAATPEDAERVNKIRFYWHLSGRDRQQAGPS